jgi:hypothetical protein
MDTSNEEENWSFIFIEEYSPAPPPEDIEGPFMPRLGPIQQHEQSTTNIGAMGQDSLRDPPQATGVIISLGRILVDRPSRAPEDFPDFTMHSFS